MRTKSSFVELFYLTTFYGSLILLCYFNCYFPLLQTILFRIPRVKQRRNLASPRYCQLQVHHINLHLHRKWSDPRWQQEPGRIQITLAGIQTAREVDLKPPPIKSLQSTEVWRMEDQVRLTAQLAATTVMVPCPSRIPDLCITTTKDFKVKSNNASRTQLLHLSWLINLWPKKVRDQEVYTARMSWRRAGTRVSKCFTIYPEIFSGHCIVDISWAGVCSRASHLDSRFIQRQNLIKA